MAGIKPDENAGGEVEILGKITKPFVNLIVQLDKKVLECWSEPGCTKYENSSLIKSNCASKKSKFMVMKLASADLGADLYELSSTTDMSVDEPTSKCKLSDRQIFGRIFCMDVYSN